VSPLVSVIIPSYNHAPYLSAAIDSVLAQTVEDLELVIADDGSTDSSLEIARRYAGADPRVTVVTHEDHANRGLGPTISLAFSATRGRYMLGLASDDMLYPDTLEREIALLDARPEVGYVYGYAHLVDREGHVIEVQGPRGPEIRTFGADLTGEGRIVERLVQGNAIPGMTAMFRRECLDQAGPEHPTLVYGDWERQTRAAAHWEVAFIPRALAMYRVHGANASFDVPREIRVTRHLEVTTVLREIAPSVGGRLAEPRIRAVLELQTAYLRFAAGEPEAETELLAAFERDPSLAGDARWLADWLWSRLLDELLPNGGPDFVQCFDTTVRPLLEPSAERTMRREVAAARAEARAIRLARAGQPVQAGSAALAAVALSPRRLRDRRLLGVLLDSIVATPAGSALRKAKRGLLRHVRVVLP
jgi:GT2 family glycosyltransferase